MKTSKHTGIPDTAWAFILPLVLFSLFAGLIVRFRAALMLPAFSEFLETARQAFSSGDLVQNLLVTLRRFLTGFAFGAGIGFFIGFVCGLSRKVRMALEPFIYFLYPIPRFALFPFLILLFGTGFISHAIIIALGGFFPMVINTLSGFDHINRNFLEVARHYGARGVKLYQRVIFPGTLPQIFAGLRISLGLTLAYTVIIEFLSSLTGIGAMMWLSMQMLRMDRLLLGAMVIASLNVFFMLMLRGAERFFMPWERNSRNNHD